MKSARSDRRRAGLLLALLPLLLLGGCDGCSSPTEPKERPLGVPEVLEAMFLGTGPASEGGSPSAVWTSFPRGSTVRLVVAASVDGRALPHLERQVSDLNQALSGFLTIQLDRSPEEDPRPAPGEVTLAEVDGSEIDAISGEPGAGGTCREIDLAGPGEILRARCVIRTGSADHDWYVHEVGHGLGFSHVRDGTVAAMMNPSAPVSDFTPLELEAIRRVATSGLEHGSNRVAFFEAGLIGGG